MTQELPVTEAMASETLVPMRPDHVDALMAHEREMFTTEAWTRTSYLAELADRENRTYFAVEDANGALLAWGGVRVVGDEAELLTIGVIPAARRNGVGRRLLAALLEAAARAGAIEAYLEVRVDNAAARALYTGDGWVELGVRRGYYDAGRVDAVTMRRVLGQVTGA